jgi:hypothetical protein
MEDRELDHGWSMVDLYKDGDLVAKNSEGNTTAWVEDIDGVRMLALGDEVGIVHGYIPILVIDQLQAATP